MKNSKHPAAIIFTALFSFIMCFGVCAEETRSTEDRINEALSKLQQIKPITKELTERVLAGERAPGTNGVDFEKLLSNHAELLTESGVWPELENIFLAGYGINGGSCVGTKPIPEMWCKKCIAPLPFGGCLVEALPQARAHRFPTQVTEIAHIANQSDFTLDILLKLSKELKFGMSAVGPLQGAWAMLTENAELKPKFIQFYLLQAAQKAALGGNADLSGLVGDIQSSLTKVKMNRKVLDTAKEVPAESRGQFVSLPDESFQQYGHVEAPTLALRALAKWISEANWKVPSIGVVVGPGFVEPFFFEDDLLVQVNKPPYNPAGFDTEGLRYLGNPSSQEGLALQEDRRVQVADNSLLGGGLSDVIGGGSLRNLRAGLPNGIDKINLLEGIGNGGRRFRRSEFLGIFDMVGSQIVNPITAPVQMGTSLESTWSFFAFFKPQVLGGTLPGFQQLLKDPFKCSDPKIREAFGKYDFSNKEVKKIEAIMSIFIPGFSADFSQLNGYMGLKKIPTCLPFGKAASMPVATILNTPSIGSVVNKAVGIDGAFAPEYTKVRRLFGGSSSLNFYRNDFDIAVPEDWQSLGNDKELEDLINGGLVEEFDGEVDGSMDKTQIDKRLTEIRGFGSTPSGCAHPFRSSDTMDGAADHVPLDPTQKQITWTSFKRCPFGSPVGPKDTVLGVPIFKAINMAMQLAGIDFQIHRFKERVD